MIITIIRKPLIKNVVENITLHNTGGINIDATRVGTENMSAQWDREWSTQSGVMGCLYDQKWREKGKQVPDGRFPANLLLTADTVLRIDEQSGVVSTGSGKRQKDGAHPFGNATGSEYSKWKTVQEPKGGASRYFKVVIEE